jgi:hypothetical protein
LGRDLCLRRPDARFASDLRDALPRWGFLGRGLFFGEERFFQHSLLFRRGRERREHYWLRGRLAPAPGGQGRRRGWLLLGPAQHHSRQRLLSDQLLQAIQYVLLLPSENLVQDVRRDQAEEILGA